MIEQLLGQGTFLHVGCGGKRIDQTPFVALGWHEIRLDIDPEVEPDLIGTMTDMANVADGSVDAVYSSHNIEHLYAHEVPLALAEFRRVLRPAGFVLITCPDLRSVAELVAADKLTDCIYDSPMGPITPIDILYGHRDSLRAGNAYMAHRCGFTERVLVGTLRGAGFRQILSLSRPKTFDLWALATLQEWSDAALQQAQGFLLYAAQ